MNKTMIALLVAALVAPFAAAHHSVGGCGPEDNFALGAIEVGPNTGDGTATFYIDDRAFVGGNGFWIYQETNGVYGTDLDLDGDVDAHDNLQRGGVSITGGDSGTDPCVDTGPWDGDMIIF